MAKKKISFNIDEDVHYKVKELALKNRTTVTEIYTKWIKESLEKETNQTRLD
jgi:predicted transcriptional regulator